MLHVLVLIISRNCHIYKQVIIGDRFLSRNESLRG